MWRLVVGQWGKSLTPELEASNQFVIWLRATRQKILRPSSSKSGYGQTAVKMRRHSQFLYFFTSFLFLCLSTRAADYHEQLVLRPLPLSALLASFNFRSNTSLSDFEAHNFRFFPRSLGQILQYADTRELHLRFGLGRWDAESWGARPWEGAREGGTGVELWAWLDADTDEEYAPLRLDISLYVRECVANVAAELTRNG